MKERPILFSGPMVRAILAGRKTQTRRVCKPGERMLKILNESPYGIPGDRLWVRESLTHIVSDPVTAQPCDVHCYTASIPAGMTSANPYEPNYLFPQDGEPHLQPKNTPGIFMPRWASRITLEIVNVRLERLQEISGEDARAEGAGYYVGGEGFVTEESMRIEPGYWHGIGGYRTGFSVLWDSLNGAGAWDKNPWVWVIEFKHITTVNAPRA